MINKETFCPLPFERIFLGADSGVKQCCSSRIDIGNLNQEEIKSILKNDKAQEVRQSIIDNQWHASCLQCREIESLKGSSERSVRLEESFREYSKINLDRNYFKLKSLDLRWTNTCNLACNYCYEYFSSQWSNIKGLKINTLNEINEHSLFDFIEEDKDQVTHIHLLGGEPLLQKQNLKLLQLLENNTAKFYVLTNLAVPLGSNKIAEKLIALPGAEWGVSFENLGEKFEYIRHNASWDVFNKNLDYLADQRTNFKLNVHPVYCTYSAFDLVEYYDFLLNKKIFDGVYWAILQNTDALNVIKMPLKLKELAIREIENCEREFRGASGINTLSDFKSTIIQSLDKPIKISQSFNQFTNILETSLHNKSFKFGDLWPEIANLLADDEVDFNPD